MNVAHIYKYIKLNQGIGESNEIPSIHRIIHIIFDVMKVYIRFHHFCSIYIRI